MIEFLYEYGMFLAKTLTFVVAFLFILGGVATAASRKGPQGEDGSLRVKDVNEELKNLQDGLAEELLSDAERKLVHKKRKKEEKEKQKEDKKQAKTADKKSVDEIEAQKEDKSRVFVLDFDGDMHASAVGHLRREISAVLQVASDKDEIVVRLESPGGLVHGYGLAASQLKRVREKNIPLTICVDQVAASGGYMMACIGNKILAAPFAVIGSIGVVAQIPNIHRLLKKNDVDVELMTAGEYKRTLTMLGENTDKMREKFQEELDDTHQLFKEFVQDNRPELELDKVATGEHWFGLRAQALGLVDELKTSDEYLIDRSKEAKVYEVRWEERRRLMERFGFSMEGAATRMVDRLWQKLSTRWIG